MLKYTHLMPQNNTPPLGWQSLCERLGNILFPRFLFNPLQQHRCQGCWKNINSSNISSKIPFKDTQKFRNRNLICEEQLLRLHVACLKLSLDSNTISLRKAYASKILLFTKFLYAIAKCVVGLACQDVLKYTSLLYVYYIDSMVHAAVGCVYISQVHWVNRTFICNTKGPSLAQAMGWLGFFELSNSIV